jgi:ribosomal protein S18 acetylase RimI-like enzyme
VNKYLRDAITFPRDARAAWRHRGASGVWRELRVRTLDRIIQWGHAVLLEHALLDTPRLPLPDGVRITPFAGPDWTRFLELTSPARIAGFRQRIARGRECLVAWRGERPVAFMWISTRMDRDMETYPLPLPPDVTYHWDLHVASSERGNGIGTALAFEPLHHSCGKVFRAGWRLIDFDNFASQRGAQKTAGPSTRVIGEVRYVRIFGWSWCGFTPGEKSPRTGNLRAALGQQR